ncbi:MFS transporter [Glacieibacterium sp.]|uniref:MFS transporter n=1 Tax=Glacieibacterium sp. TaxID=2860237 RepID=UPI003AFFFC3D
MKLNLPLIALAAGAFGIGTTEFAPMGLLPVIAADLKVSIPTAGLLVSGYALGVVAGAPLLTLTTGRLPRKTLLLMLMAIFTIGNLLSAISPSYGILLFARVITSLCHGAFFGVGSVVAASVVAPDKRAGAVASMFMGLTIANIGGVPLATWAGQHLGWRAAFGGIAGLGVVAMLALQFALPKVPPAEPIDVHSEIGVMKRPAVLLALATTALGSAAMFTVFTYIAPILQQVTHVSPAVVTLALVVYGIGLTVGNYLGGKFADKALTPTLIVVLVALTGLLLLFAWTMNHPVAAVATVFAWGVATFALVPGLQTRVMQVAHDAPTLASSINIGAFNLGNAIGAALGGAVIGLGLGYPWVSVAGAAMAAGALLLVIVTRERPAAP